MKYLAGVFLMAATVFGASSVHEFTMDSLQGVPTPLAQFKGKAVADPLANRLQRVFGVSQLKIDPSFTSGSQVPQVRLTLQQQVAPNLLFTYVTALDNPNTQIARIEWSMTPQWSATANRDENGIVSINFLYKKQFR